MSSFYKVRITAWRDFFVKADSPEAAWEAVTDEHYNGDFDLTEGDISGPITDESRIDQEMTDDEVKFIDWSEDEKT